MVKLAGKPAPEQKELQETLDNSLKSAEIYLEEGHIPGIDEVEQRIEILNDSELEIASVHTTHFSRNDFDWLERADQLADRTDSFLVVHSMGLPETWIPKVEDQIDFDADYGYEHNAGISMPHIENTILAQDHSLVLDTAHLYLAHPESYMEQFQSLLDDYLSQVELIHLNDATTENGAEDGLAFEDGEMPLEETYRLIRESPYDGTVVLEVPQGDREGAYRKCQEWEENLEETADLPHPQSG